MSVISHMLYKVQDSTCQDFGWASMLQGHEVNPGISYTAGVIGTSSKPSS